MLIDVPADSQVHRQVVRKRAEAHPISIDPVVRLYLVDVEQPDMHDPASDFRRLCDALERQWGLTNLVAPLPFLTWLQKILRQGEWQVTVAVRGKILVAIYPGYKERVYGVAVDVGLHHDRRAFV